MRWSCNNLMAAVASTLRLARSMVGSGRWVDVEGLDRTIGILCARALDLPPDQGRRVRPNLALLLIELDALSVAMHVP